MLKRISKGVLVLCMFLTTLIPFMSSKAVAAEGEVEIVVHKRVLRDADLSDFTLYQNDGKEASQDSDIIAKTTFLDGAIFDVYEVTQLYQESQQSDVNFIELLNEMNSQAVIDYLQAHGDKPILKDLKTNSEAEDGGILRFKVPTYNSQCQSAAAYIIVETGVDPAAGVTIDLTQSRPLTVVLPVNDPITNQELSTIHLYPKNISQLSSPYFYKIGQKEDGTEVPLSDVSFVLYRLNEAGEKEYLDARSTTDLNERWKASDNPKNDATLSRYTSNQQGLVDMGEYLSAGTYYLQEVQGAEGYVLNETPVPLVIPETKTAEDGTPQEVKINDQTMAAREADGSIPASASSKQEPRIYNKAKTTLPKTSGDDPAKPNDPIKTVASKVLPKTNEGRSILFTLLGVLILGGLYLYRKKQLRKE